jgi:hypothetical protein
MIIVNNRVRDLPAGATNLIDKIIATNTTINNEAVLGDKVSQQEMATYLQIALQPNGAHGNKELYIAADGRTTTTLISIGLLLSLAPRSKAGYFWLAYARKMPPPHAGNDICALTEFFVPGTTAKTRLLYEYLRGMFLWTIDHYTTYALVEDHNGALVRDFKRI